MMLFWRLQEDKDKIKRRTQTGRPEKRPFIFIDIYLNTNYNVTMS